MTNNDLKHISARGEEFLKCLRCGKCRAVCPVFIYGGREMNSPRGRIALMNAVADGDLKLNDALKNYVANCLHCMRCTEACSSGVHGEEMALAINAQLASRDGLGPIKSILFRLLLGRMELMPQLTHWGGLFGELVDFILPEDSPWRDVLPVPAPGGLKLFPKPSPVSFMNIYSTMPKLKNPDKKVAYFVGCALNYVFTEIPVEVVKYFRKSNVEVEVPLNQGCCGLPAYSYGDLKTARRLAYKFKNDFENLDVDAIIISCATGGHMLREVFPAIIDFDIPVYTEMEYILKEELIDEVKIEGSVAYHAPCHLYRGQGVKDEPKEFLKSISNDFVGAITEGECCGAGGFYHLSHPEISERVVDEKIEAFLGSGADILLTACPGCKVFLDGELIKRGTGKRCKHIFEVIDL